jgi:hypothetical protein
MPETYLDELTAWGAVPLDGNLAEIEGYYTQAVNDRQLWLFEDV